METVAKSGRVMAQAKDEKQRAGEARSYRNDANESKDGTERISHEPNGKNDSIDRY